MSDISASASTKLDSPNRKFQSVNTGRLAGVTTRAQSASAMSKLTSPNQQGKPNRTPIKPKGGKITLESLAGMIGELSQRMETRFEGVDAEFGDIKTNYTAWQTKAEERLTKVESNETQFKIDLGANTTKLTAIDQSQTNINVELRELRHENTVMKQQLLATQAVVKKMAMEQNLNGRTIKSYHIRFGKVREPITPESSAKKDREDTKSVIADTIVKHSMYPNKTKAQIIEMIDVAYRTGESKEGAPRHIMCKFNRRHERNTIMRTGKRLEREKKTNGVFLMDDLTPDDQSTKRCCHGIMKKLKDEDKRPFFQDGKLKSTDGIIKIKAVEKFNRKHGIENKREKEISVDILKMDQLTMTQTLDPTKIPRLTLASPVVIEPEEEDEGDEETGGEKID